MRVAVTGGMGFIGTQIVGDLLAHGHEVVVVDFCKKVITAYDQSGFPILRDVYTNLPRCYAIMEPDEFIEQIPRLGLDVIVHAGAWVDTQNVCEDLFAQNFDYVDRLLGSICLGREKLVFISSASVYGNEGIPMVPYALSKAVGEKKISSIRGLAAVSFRLFNVFGKYEHHKGKMASVPFQISQAFSQGLPFSMFYPSADRDFVPVSVVSQTVVRSVEGLIHQPMTDKPVYDLGTGTSTSFLILAGNVADAMGIKNPQLKLIDPPPGLKGYQMHTRAGERGPANAGSGDTVSGLKEMYG